MKAENILIEKAKYAFGCASNKSLAALIGIGESAFYSAKTKQRTIRNHIIDLAIEKRISIDWLIGHNGKIPEPKSFGEDQVEAQAQ